MTKKRSINLVENTIYGHIEICQFMRYNNIYQLIVLMNTSCQKLVVCKKWRSLGKKCITR